MYIALWSSISPWLTIQLCTWNYLTVALASACHAGHRRVQLFSYNLLEHHIKLSFAPWLDCCWKYISNAFAPPFANGAKREEEKKSSQTHKKSLVFLGIHHLTVRDLDKHFLWQIKKSINYIKRQFIEIQTSFSSACTLEIYSKGYPLLYFTNTQKYHIYSF